jgi:hypothetical protein
MIKMRKICTIYMKQDEVLLIQPNLSNHFLIIHYLGQVPHQLRIKQQSLLLQLFKIPKQIHLFSRKKYLFHG